MKAAARVQEGSWLSLVAETAGVAGAGVARVELISAASSSRLVTCVVQLVGRYGQVLAATRWVGPSADLTRGVKIDLAYDLESTEDVFLVGWRQEKALTGSAYHEQAPVGVSALPFDPTRAMKLMLGRPPLSFERRGRNRSQEAAA